MLTRLKLAQKMQLGFANKQISLLLVQEKIKNFGSIDKPTPAGKEFVNLQDNTDRPKIWRGPAVVDTNNKCDYQSMFFIIQSREPLFSAD